MGLDPNQRAYDARIGVRREGMSMASSDILRGTVSGVWIAVGSILLLCGIACLASMAAGGSFVGTSIAWCGGICAILGVVFTGAGAALYYALGAKARTL